MTNDLGFKLSDKLNLPGNAVQPMLPVLFRDMMEAHVDMGLMPNVSRPVRDVVEDEIETLSMTV